MTLASGRVVTPYSGLTIRASSSCKFFFPFEELITNPYGTVTDITRGITYAPISNLSDLSGRLENNPTLNGAAYASRTVAVYNNQLNTAVNIGGTWPQFGTNSFLTLSVGRVMSSASDWSCVRSVIGNGTAIAAPDGGFSTFSSSWGGGHHVVVSNAANTASISSTGILTGNALTVGEDVYIITAYQPNTRLLSKAMTLNGTVRSVLDLNPTNAPSAPWGTIGAISPSNQTRIGGLAFYGFAGFLFTTLPTDMETACNWMANSWVNGKRYLYPGWA